MDPTAGGNQHLDDSPSWPLASDSRVFKISNIFGYIQTLFLSNRWDRPSPFEEHVRKCFICSAMFLGRLGSPREQVAFVVCRHAPQNHDGFQARGWVTDDKGDHLL